MGEPLSAEQPRSLHDDILAVIVDVEQAQDDAHELTGFDGCDDRWCQSLRVSLNGFRSLASRAETLERELAEARAEVEAARINAEGVVESALRIHAECRRLRDALEAVRALHVRKSVGDNPDGTNQGDYCATCTHSNKVVRWPCPTIRAVTGVLGEG